MKKCFLIVLSVLFFCAEMSLAKPVEIGPLYYELNASKKTAQVTNIGDDDPFADSYSAYKHYMFSWPMEVEIPSTVTYKGVKYTVTAISAYAFQFSNTRSVTIPGTVKVIGAGAFWSSEYLEKVVLCPGVESIEADAFNGCKLLRSINFSDGIQYIGNSAFSDCEELKVVTLGKGLECIDDYAFSGCKLLKSINLPYGLKMIGAGAFERCESLQSIIIPTTVATIGTSSEGAFYKCKNLEYVSMGRNHMMLMDNSFGDCAQLQTVVMNAIIPPPISNTVFSAWEQCTLYVPAESVQAYKSTYPWSRFRRILPMPGSAEIQKSSITTGIPAQKVITDADILSVNSTYRTSEPKIHAMQAPIGYMTIGTRIAVTSPWCVDMANARDKAAKESKCTISATSTEVTIFYKTAELLNSDWYENSGKLKRPDVTGCKHGHHDVPAVMILGDGVTYTGKADYDCTYTGHQVICVSGGTRLVRNAAGQVVSTSDAQGDIAWYVEHAITQHINFATFAKSANISTNEMVKRVLYYGIRSFIAEDHDFGDGGIRDALFKGAGYKAKQDANASAKMNDWNAAKNEMKKKKPDFEKASRLFISGGKQLHNANDFGYEYIDEVDKLFEPFIIPLAQLEPYDTLYVGKMVRAYQKTMDELESTRPDKSANALVARLLFEMRDYNPAFFETYNRLYDMQEYVPSVQAFLQLHHTAFRRYIKQYATIQPDNVERLIGNYMNNPLKGDSCIDTLIIAKTQIESLHAKKKLQEGDFDLLYMFRHAPDSAMWNRSQTTHKGCIMYGIFEEYYSILNQSVLSVFDTLCTMIIQGDAPKVREICHNQFDTIFGAYNEHNLYRYDLFHYYYNSYDYATYYAQCIEVAADSNSVEFAQEMQEELRRLAYPKGRKFMEDCKMGHVVNRRKYTEAERTEIRNRIANVQKQVLLCREAADFDFETDFLVVVETGNKPLENFEFGVGMKDKFIPIKEVYIDGKLVKIKPKKHTKKWQTKQWLYKYKGTLQPVDNNSFHCFIFKGKEGMSGIGEEPFLFNRTEIPTIYWIDYPSSANGNSSNPADKIYKQDYLRIFIH